MTIIQIAALKKVKKGSRILLMDKNGGVAKDVAKGLNSRGYKKVFVVEGGFNGWTAAKLQTRGSTSVHFLISTTIDHFASYTSLCNVTFLLRRQMALKCTSHHLCHKQTSL